MFEVIVERVDPPLPLQPGEPPGDVTVHHEVYREAFEGTFDAPVRDALYAALGVARKRRHRKGAAKAGA